MAKRLDTLLKVCSHNVLCDTRRQLSALSMSEAINRAEICLGYSIKDLSVKHIVCNHKIQSLIRESSLSQPNEHPVLSAERKLDPEIEVNYKSRALLTLLLAKAVSVRGVERSPQYKFNLNVGNNSGYLTKQLLLAQTIELIYGASVFHSTGIAPLRPRSDTADTKSLDSVVKGNRVAVLTGDYMFASATKNLVKLKNSRVSDLMSKAVRDFVEGEYLNMKAREDIESGNWSDLLDNWVRITTLKSCSLIANGCQSMAHLTTNCETVEEQLYKFGYNVGYAWNVTEELDNFHRLRNQNKSRANTDLMFSLPMLLHFKSNPGLKASISSCDSIKTFIDNTSEEVNQSDSIKKSQSLIEFYANSALQQLRPLPDSQAKSVLSDIVSALIQKQT